MNECDCTKNKSVQLRDGIVVCSYCEHYRHYCEAVALLRMQLPDRREQLNQVECQRGKKAANHLKETMIYLWQKKRPA